MQHDYPNKTSTEISLQRDNSPTETIDSLIQYIENMETDKSLEISRNIMKPPRNSMAKYMSDTVPTTDAIIKPSVFYRLQE